MTRTFARLIVVAAVLAAAGGGYWFGRRQMPAPEVAVNTAPTMTAEEQGERAPLYYKDPMGKPDYSPTPKKDSMGMDYIAVYQDEEDAPAQPAQASASAKSGTNRVLYYRNPMGLPDTSPVPKKDSMGMDYIPVYQDEGGGEGPVIRVSRERIQTLGVRSAPIEMRDLSRVLHAVGTVQPDERKLYLVNTKFDGWIEKLRVNATGQSVRRGQPLMEIYAPELVAAQQEYGLAWHALQDMGGAADDVRASAKQLADAALQRLRNWDISDDQVRRLQRETLVARTLTLRSPADGVVMEKIAVEGMRFSAGEALYRIADLSTVWLIADLFEQDLAAVHEGQSARVTVNAYPGASFPGKVDFIYPTVAQDTRTGKVRIVIANPDGRLKTGMYANVAIDVAIGTAPSLAVPDSAVLDSGMRQTVLIDRGDGRFEPREVRIGAHADGYYAVLEGLEAGDRVVVSANFLIDAESNLRAALNAFAAQSGDAPPPAGGGR